jgi:hypothetical protein
MEAPTKKAAFYHPGVPDRLRSGAMYQLPKSM